MPQVEHLGMFTTVDALEDPGALIGLMDAVQDVPGVRDLRADVLARLDLKPGGTVLDLGCGTGDHTRDLAGLVSPGGRAVGVDFSASMIGEAVRRQRPAPLPPPSSRATPSASGSTTSPSTPAGRSACSATSPTTAPPWARWSGWSGRAVGSA